MRLDMMYGRAGRELARERALIARPKVLIRL
nr:MAG TPA: hypothetical protein [Caudoviricetes sp.]